MEYNLDISTDTFFKRNVMTPQQWLQAKLTLILTTNNPQADPASVSLLATELSNLWSTLILPNLTVNLSTGSVTFNVPSGS